MKTLPLLLASLAVAAPASAQQSAVRPRPASVALSAGAGYEHGRFVLDTQYTSGRNAVAVTAGVRFR